MTSSPTWTPDQPIIRCRDVHKSFGSLQVLKGISLELMKGDVVCVIGPSGSGKSTFIRCINALTPMDGGSITVEGQEVKDRTSGVWGKSVSVRVYTGGRRHIKK